MIFCFTWQENTSVNGIPFTEVFYIYNFKNEIHSPFNLFKIIMKTRLTEKIANYIWN